MTEPAPAPAEARPEIDDLVRRTRVLITQSIADVAGPPAMEATRFVTRKVLSVVLGAVLVCSAVVLILGGAVMLVSQYVPLWATCLGAGVLALLIGVIVLLVANR